MNAKDKIPDNLVYEQTWEDVKYLLIIITIIYAIFYFTSQSLSDKTAFIILYFYFVILIIVVYNFFGIRKFEVYPDKIIITFPRNRKRIISKDEIEKIKVEYIPGFLLGNRVKWHKTVFRFYLKKELNVLFYRKKLSINNYLLGDTATGEKTIELVNYLHRYYRDILEILQS